MTSFFQYFPKIVRNNRTQVDITARIDFFSKIKKNITLFEHYNVVDGQKPEDLAYLLYGDPELYWIILYINDMVDPFYDWVLSDKRLREYVSAKYGSENIYEVHHYETLSTSSLGAGIIVDATEPFSTAVTNYNYEDALNQNKRKIKILKRRFLDQVLTEYKNQF